VQNATAASIYLERKEGDLWVPEATTFRTDWLPDIQIPQPKTHIAYLIPLAKLRARGQFRVVVTSDVKDFDPSPTGGKPVQQPSFEFTVSGHGDPFGSIRLTDPTRMASIGNLVCAATEGNSKLALLKMGPSGLESMGTFGADGSTFLGQEIVAVKGFEGIVLPGWPRTGLLLVTTAPKPGDVDHQGVLWGFHLCSESAPPKLIFGVSLGVGSLGYTPTIDYRDGMMLAGRLTGSVQVYSLSKAIYGWGDRPAREATFLQGANQSSLVQPFYLSDPAYEWKDGTSSVQSIASHWGVAFGPNSTLVDGTSAVQAFVGSTRYWAQYRNQSLTGAPRIQIPFHPDRAYKIENPFVPDPDSVTIGASRNAPPGHLRAIPGVLPDGKSASSVVAWPRASVILQGVTATKDLMLALSGWQPELKNVDGTSAGKLGNSLIILDAGLPGAVEVGHWPLNPPFGSGVTYEILNRRISLDPLSRTCALGVANKAEGKLYWFLVDLQNPSNPKVFDIVAPEEGAGSYGELSYGRFLSSGTDGQLRAWTVSTGIPSPAPPDMLGRSNCDLLLTQGLLLADVLDGDSGLDPETIRVERVGDASTSTILSQCIWLKGSEDGKNFVDMPLRLKGPVKHLFLRLTGLPQGTYKLRIWIADRAGNPEMEQNLDAIQNGLSIERTLTFGGDIQ
jgi:hypothetical protein